MGVHERRQREKEKRRLEIINAAEKVFLEKGFDNSTMDDVAHEAELSKGAVYFYFKSKAEICLSILLRLLDEINDNFKQILQTNASGFEKYKEMCLSYMQFYDNHPTFLTAVTNFRSHKEHCDAESSVLQTVLDINHSITSSLKSSLEDGITDGSVIKDIKPDILSRAFWGDLNGLLLSLSVSDIDAKNHGYQPSERIFLYIMNLMYNSIKN